MEEEPHTPSKRKQNGKHGVVSRFLKGIFRGDDLENQLQLLSKEETSVRARMKKRARSSRHVARNVIAVSMSLEVFFFSCFCQLYVYSIILLIFGNMIHMILVCLNEFFLGFSGFICYSCWKRAGIELAG
jgi:hypothetical protein